MSVSSIELTDLIPSIGVAEVLIGDPFTSGGLTSLGLTEGDVSGNITYSSNDLTAPEWTGGVPHQRSIMVESAVVTVPVIVSDDTLYAKISPTGTKSGGWSGQQQAQTTSVVLIPRAELGGSLAYDGIAWTRTAGNGVEAATGAAAAPKHALWLWRAVPMPGARPFRFADGGKMIVEVTFTAMVYPANPEGQKVFTTGDPVVQGVTTLLL